jgi:hypothetical protein
VVELAAVVVAHPRTQPDHHNKVNLLLNGLVTLAIAAALVLGSCSGDSVDPTEQSFGLPVKNDTSHTVRIRLCSNDKCRSLDPPEEDLKPGEVGGVGMSDENVETWFVVTDASTGSRIGCLRLQYDQKDETVGIKLSQTMIPCFQ